MGYGGSRADAGRAIGRSGDGGIDGIIKEDRLGLDVVYIQAKRWENNSVGRPDVMQFAGALQAQKANAADGRCRRAACGARGAPVRWGGGRDRS